MLEKVASAICDYNMLDDCQKIVCALSGGADSIAMTLALKKLGYDIRCVHVNHNLRGEESKRDENFCVNFCENNNIELEVFSVDVKTFSKERSMSCEEAARALRYECLQNSAKGAKIATAHTLDDNLETVIFNLSRGTGLKGLCGIPAVRDGIIRPMIYVSRAEIEKYLSDNGAEFVTDSTNGSNDCSRNRIRHNVVPVLKDINSGVLSSVLCMKKTLENENAYIEKCSNDVFDACFDGKSSLSGLKCYDKALRRRCIMRLLAQNNIECSFERIAEIDKMLFNEKTSRLDVSNGFDIICRKGILILHKRTEEFCDFCHKLEIGENEFVGGRVVVSELIECNTNDKINILLAKDHIDYDKIKGNLFLRTRHRGDKIRLVNRDFTSNVKTLLNAEVLREERDSLCFVCDDEGLIFIERIGVADRVKLDENTKRILRITAYSD